jgi:hypothetical protein
VSGYRVIEVQSRRLYITDGADDPIAGSRDR